MRAGVPLKIAAKVDVVDQAYFDERIRPLLAHPLIEFIGEIGEREKSAFLGGARALLFPIDWPEPFGLVAIEAMACGTPVVAFRCGAAPEVIDPGLTGFVVDTIDDAGRAVARIGTLDRARVRAAFERRFSVERMADDYLAAYASLREAPPAIRQLARASLADVA
jgi:glycosyltransferase involved in cell wall biosynthesis